MSLLICDKLLIFFHHLSSVVILHKCFISLSTIRMFKFYYAFALYINIKKYLWLVINKLSHKHNALPRANC